MPAAEPALVRCHCKNCRNWHASAYSCLLPLTFEPEAFSSEAARGYESDCFGGLGRLRRVFCGRCWSSVGAIPVPGDDAGGAVRAYAAAGCLADASIPEAVAVAWRAPARVLAKDAAPPWWTAAPADDRTAGPRALRGRCACGACAFVAPSGDEFQTQHCYCGICRRLSGAAAQTWIPVRPKGFRRARRVRDERPPPSVRTAPIRRWTSRDSLELVRTTKHGKRHVCTACGTVLTIVYNSQPDCIWPVAGVIDDGDYPSDLGAALCRSIHICCLYKQPWYELPQDGLDRLAYAG